MLKASKVFALSLIAGCCNTAVCATDVDLPELYGVYQTVQLFCGGISDKISRISGVAKANTAVTAVGTVASGAALVVGIEKSKTDKRIEELQRAICNNGGCDPDTVDKMSDEQFVSHVLPPFSLALIELQEEQDAEIEKSKRQGNWRTGFLAGGVGVNIASAIIAGLNKDQSDLIQQITACNVAVNKLRSARRAAIKDDINSVDMSEFKDTISSCGTINTSDVEKIEKHMAVVMGTSIGGAVVGAIGTGTSIAANTGSVRNDDTVTGKQREKNLNTAANVSAGVATATGAVSTGFNISLIKLAERLIETAEQCEETLQ